MDPLWPPVYRRASCKEVNIQGN